jgi:membrane protein involved in colicin uptake
VFLLHATHKLQSLDVVLYGPLLGAYNRKLTAYLHNSQGLLALKKGDFFLLFWGAWTLSFTMENIILSFKHTGINPMDPEVVLKQLQNLTPQENKSFQEDEIGAGSLWRQIHNLIVSTVKDTESQEAKQLSNAFHSLQTQSELEKHENKGLRAVLDTKKKRKEKKYTLDFGKPRENTGSAMFFTPSKVKKAQFIQKTKEQDQEAETLEKAENKQRKAEAAALKKKEKEEAKVAREEAKKARQVKAQKIAAARAQNRADTAAAKAQKASTVSVSGPSNSLPKAGSRPKPKRGASQLQGGGDGIGPPPKASRTRTIRAPERYSE